jgi:hypothetical protein
MPKKMVTFVDLSDVYEHIGFTDDEVEWIADGGFDCVTFGDAEYTLIGNNFALHCIVGGLMSYYDWLNENDDSIPSRLLPARIFTKDEIEQKFWELVGKDDYINLES